MSAYKWMVPALAMSLAGCGGGGGGGGNDRDSDPSPELRSGPLMFSHVAFRPTRSFNLLADFNEDGRDDLLMLPAETMQNQTSGVYFRPGSPTELFDEAEVVSSSLFANDGAAIADFNGDSHLDVILGRASLYMLPGNGDGTFGSTITVDTLTGDPDIRTPIAADVDADGDPDILGVVVDVAAPGSPFIAAYLNDGAGNFTRVDTNVLDGQIMAGAPADFDNDGHLDTVVLGGSPFGFNVYFGTGSGTFGSPLAVASPAYCLGGVVGDINGDTHPDFVAIGANDQLIPEMITSLGDGLGSFTTVPAYTASSGGLVVFRYSFLLDELTGDGMPDILMSYGGLAHWLMEGNGDGTFNTEVIIATNNASNAVASDFTGDGNNDVYVGVLIPGTGSGLATLPSFFVNGTASTLVPVDADLDGDDDLIAIIGNEVRTILSNGDNTFIHTDTDALVTSLSGCDVTAYVADFNGDGFDDLAATCTDYFTSQGLVAYLNNGDGTIDLSASFDMTMNFVTFVEMAPPADLDNDGNLDLYGIIQMTELAPNDLIGGSVWVAFGNGDGTFDPLVYPFTDVPGAVTSADLDNDGLRSVLVHDLDAGMVRVFHTQSNQTFTAGAVLSADVRSDTVVVVGNLDNDSRDDIVVREDAGTISTYYGNASNGFDTGQTLTLGGGGSVDIGLKIVEAAGVPRVLATRGTSGDPFYNTQLNVFEQTGMRQFAFLDRVMSNNGLNTDTRVADLNVDGDLDLISAQGSLEILRGNSSGSFNTPLYFDVSVLGGGTVALGDWDADGDLDVAAPDNVSIIIVDNHFFD